MITTGTYFVSPIESNLSIDSSGGIVKIVLPTAEAIANYLLTSGGIAPEIISYKIKGASLFPVRFYRGGDKLWNNGQQYIEITKDGEGTITTQNGVQSIVESSDPNSGGASSLVLIGTITKDDVNAHVGESSFVKGSNSYGGKAIITVVTKLVEAFDQDVVQAGIIDLVSGYQVAPQAIGGVGSLTVFSFDAVVSLWIQDAGSTFGIMGVRLGKGNFNGGNTTGLIEVYAKFESLP